MSDSVKKYYEMVEDGLIDENYNPEAEREEKILALLTAAAKAGKVGQVELRAKEVMDEFNTTSLLLGLQIACDELL